LEHGDWAGGQAVRTGKKRNIPWRGKVQGLLGKTRRKGMTEAEQRSPRAEVGTKVRKRLQSTEP
jgi:hypothetical protein